ncbi:MAG: DEAD/DEAH box helicase [Thermoplasmata archaeon]
MEGKTGAPGATKEGPYEVGGARVVGRGLPCVDELGLPPEVVAILKQQGLTTLYPPQAETIAPALAGKSLVLALPTASGKSLVAYLALVKKVLEGGRALYIVPLRALASEKLEDLRAFEPLGIRVGVSTGDYDSADDYLERYDVIVATSEKADSLLRHRARWLSSLSVIVADEVHLIGDPERGPTLEVLLTRFRQLNPRAQLLALSATIPNSAELARWLGASHYTSDWRPVKLREGVLFDGEVRFIDNTRIEVGQHSEPTFAMARRVILGGGQCLVFVNSRRSAESMALKARPLVAKLLGSGEREALEAEGVELEAAEVERTTMAERLAGCVRCGVAFHHAGLTPEQRRRVEGAFRSGRVKLLFATPTLAAGINMPARCVVIRDIRRFEPGVGQVFIPVHEIKQMAGRAGRPRYDTEGEAVIVARTETDLRIALDEYLLGEPEPIESKLGVEGVLRVHVLSSIASGFASTMPELLGFFRATLFARQSAEGAVDIVVERSLEFLVEEGLVKRIGEELEATPYGRRVSELYIDPLSARTIREALERARDKGGWKLSQKAAAGSESANNNGGGAAGRGGEGREGTASSIPPPTTLGLLHVAASTPDMRRVGMYLRRGDIGWLDQTAALARGGLLIPPPDDPGEYEWYLADLKLACLLQDWIDEKSEEVMTERYDVGPGDIRAKVETARWILYSMRELARLLHLPFVRELELLQRRVESGVREELLELVRLRGIGRVRARALYNAGLRSLEELAAAEREKLAGIPGIGPKVAEAIINQLAEMQVPAGREKSGVSGAADEGGRRDG